jgi:hypothetical protein
MVHNEAMQGICFSWARRLGVGGLLAAAACHAPAQDTGKPVYRCPGPPVLYTDALTPAEARDRQCRTIDGAPVTVVQGRAPTPVRASGGGAAASGPAAPSAAAPRPPVDRVDPAAQRARDSDARRILTDELRVEQERLVMMQKEFNNGEPERRGDERNYQKYLDRVAEMKANIQRKEADIAALRRELAKLPN